jgi:hypothetical protein
MKEAAERVCSLLYKNGSRLTWFRIGSSVTEGVWRGREWNRKIRLSSCEVHGTAEMETATVAREMAEC